MIYTFGAAKKTDQAQKARIIDNTGASGIGAMSEELRDEHINKKLNEALNLKGQNQNDDALKIYLEIINLDFLKESKIDKHVFMKFNAFKNLGELYERMGQYFQAKNYYTQAIKIKEKDSFIWTRLGFMEYEHFKNYSLAKECFDIAAQCLPTISRRSAQINPILMKLAELAFIEFDFKTSEKMVDSIIQRVSSLNMGMNMMAQQQQQQQQNISQNPQQNSELFAYLLKSYFLSLRGDDSLCNTMLEKARNIKPNAKYTDLEVVGKLMSSMHQNINSKDIVIRTKVINDENQQIENRYDYLQLQNQQNVITIKPSKEYNNFMEYFDDFLLYLTQQCEAQSVPTIQNSLLNCEAFVQPINDYFDALNNDQAFQVQLQDTLKFYDQQILQKERKLNNQDNLPNATQSNQTNSHQQATVNQSKRGQAQQEKQLQETKRSLRRKVDTTEQQLKQYNLKPLRDFKEFIINEGGFCDPELEVIFSHNEIYKAKCFLSQEQDISSIQDGLSLLRLGMGQDQDSVNDNNQERNQEKIEAIVQTYWKFFEIIQKIQGRGVQYILRNMLRYLIDTQINSQVFLNFENSSYLYRMFLLAINSELSFQNLEAVGSFNVLLTLFEMSLFNNQVIKHVKSNALITQRDKFYEYFVSKEQEYFTIQDREVRKLQEQQNAENNAIINKNEMIKIRFYHAMMFYSFEIKNDMHSSIKYYQRIDNEILKRQGRIQLPWISTNFKIDENKLVQYGSCKIKEAQVVKDFDEQLLSLKQQELEEAKKNNLRSFLNKIKPEFTDLACFYLDQLCQYLQKAYQSESSVNANFSTNEEKIKEMWNKLQYTLCRCDSQTLFRVSCHLFSIMTAFQSIQKQFYDNYILKKLEFEPLITEINERFRLVFNSLMDYTRNKTYNGLVELKQQLSQILGKSLLYDQIERDQVNQLTKLEIDLLRLLNNEFLYFHIVQNQFRFGDQLLNSYFSIIFFTELFVAILRSKPDDDISVQFKIIIRLVKQLDKLCYKNGEIFIRSYFKFLTYVLPPTLSFFMNQLDRQTVLSQSTNFSSPLNKYQQMNLRSTQYLNDNNDCLQLLMTLCQYFFDIKFTMKDLQKSQQESTIITNHGSSRDVNMSSKKIRTNRKDEEIKQGDAVVSGPGNSTNKKSVQEQNDDDDEDEEESEDEKKNYRLKMVYKLRTNQVKIWNIITATNWIPKVAPIFQGTTGAQITYLYNSGSIDATFLKNLFSFCNLMSSDRISQCGTLIKKDVSQMVSFLDIVGRYLQDNMKQYYDKCHKAQQMLASFKEAMTKNPFRFQIKQDAKCTCLNGKQCIQENHKHKETLSKLIRLFMNVISHMCIENSPYQIVSSSGKRRLNLSEVLYSLNGGGHSRLMKNLKRISQLDMIYSNFNTESLLLFAQLQTEFFQQANSTKLNHEYKENELYKKYKPFYPLTLNTLIIALSQLRQQIMQQQQQQQQLQQSQFNSSLGLWNNVNINKKIKLCLTQMITIINFKMQGKRFIFKRTFSIVEKETPQYQKKYGQITNLKQQIYVLSMLCEKLERLQVVSEDPRLAVNNSLNMQSTVRELLEKLFSIVQQSNKGLDEKMSFQLNPEYFESFITLITQVTGDLKSGMDQIRWKVSFDYPLIQSLLMHKFKKQKQIEQHNLSQLSKQQLKEQLDPIHQYQYLSEVANCIQIAYAQQSLNGCIECFTILVKGGLQLGLQLKYEDSLFSKQEFQELKNIFETVTKTLQKNNRQIFKFIHNKLVPLSSAYTTSRPSGNQGYDTNMSAAEDEDRERSIILDDKLASSVQRPQIFATQDMPSFNEFESSLHQLYVFGDRLFNIMALLPARQWQKMRMQFALIMALKYEIKINPINRETPDQEIKSKLKDMIQPVIQYMNAIEDNYLSQGNPNYYQDDTAKNLVTQFNHTDFSLTELRIKLREYFLEISEEVNTYEPIKEMFKRQFQLQRQLENIQKGSAGSGSNLSQLNSALALVKSVEVQHLFHITKNQLIESLYNRTDRQLLLYLNLRKSIMLFKPQASKNQDLFNELMMSYKSFREALQTTKDSVPPVLKDIFELFVDSHLKKGMLNQRKLIDEVQKRTIRQTLLKCSAFCGPDAEIQSIGDSQQLLSSKFLDLNKISDEEYECEGLLICLKWYMNILEERTNFGKERDNQEKTRAPSGSKIDQDLYKKLKTTYEELDKAVREQQQRQLLAQENQMQLTNMPQFNNQAVAAAGGQQTQMPQNNNGSVNFMPQHTSVATKVFENPQQQ